MQSRYQVEPLVPNPESRNHLLRHLLRESGGHLESVMTLETLKSQQILYQPDQRISKIYFPISSVLCMLTSMSDGHTIESATVGSEGASWISASLGAPTMPCQTMVAIGGSAYAINAKAVEEENRKNGVFHNMLLEYSHALMISVLRTGACNALHSVTQHCARWMLTTLDRTTEEQFAITQEFLASLLGCNRSILTGVLGDLQNAGAIEVRRGTIRIVDRKCLERASCECYELIRHAFDHLRVN